MLKLVFCLRRRSDLTPEEFRRHWREEHAFLLRRHAGRLRIRRYVQLDPLDADLGPGALAASRGAPEPFDGVAELWFGSAEDLMPARDDELALQAAREVLEDEKRFIDLERSPLWLFHEVSIVDEDEGRARQER